MGRDTPPHSLAPTLGTFKSEDEDEFEYKFSVLSMRIRFGGRHVGRHLSKRACSERKTCIRTWPRPIERSLILQNGGPFLESPETFRGIFGCHNSFCISRT